MGHDLEQHLARHGVDLFDNLIKTTVPHCVQPFLALFCLMSLLTVYGEVVDHRVDTPTERMPPFTTLDVVVPEPNVMA